MSKGPYIQTRSGRRFYPFDISREMISIEDIAHALSNQCRYTGHCPKFYSVAEHSVLVARRAVDLYKDMRLAAMFKHEAPEWRERVVGMQALLHDATEAYMMDLPQPYKHAPEFEIFKAAEKRIAQAIALRFGIPEQPSDWLVLADRELLNAESAVFWPEHHKEWSTYQEQDYKLPRYSCLTPSVAKRLFLDTFTSFGGQIP